MGKHIHHILKFSDVVSALSDGLCFESEQVAKLFLKVMTCMDGRVEIKELVQGLLFSRGQVAGPFSEGMDDVAFPAYGLLRMFAELDEVMLDHSDDMETVGDDFGVGKVLAHDASVA